MSDNLFDEYEGDSGAESEEKETKGVSMPKWKRVYVDHPGVMAAALRRKYNLVSLPFFELLDKKYQALSRLKKTHLPEEYRTLLKLTFFAICQELKLRDEFFTTPTRHYYTDNVDHVITRKTRRIVKNRKCNKIKGWEY